MHLEQKKKKRKKREFGLTADEYSALLNPGLDSDDSYLGDFSDNQDIEEKNPSRKKI